MYVYFGIVFNVKYILSNVISNAFIYVYIILYFHTTGGAFIQFQVVICVWRSLKPNSKKQKYSSLVIPMYNCGQARFTLPKTNSSHQKIGPNPKGNYRIPTIEFQVRAVSFREGTWRIIPFSKWLITMVSKSPKKGCSPSKWPKWLINGGY